MAATSVFRTDSSVRTVVGSALSGLSVAVLTQPAVTTTQPGSPLAAIFAASITNSAALSGASWLAGVVTFVFSAPPPADVVAGSYIQITGVNPAGYNGVFLVTGVSGNNVTAALVTNPGAYVSGGTVATSALPNPFTTDNLGNFFFYAPAGTYTVQIYDAALGRLSAPLVFADQAVVAGGAGAGSVTSVGLTMPAEFIVTGSPIAGAGTFAVTKANENANLFFAGPTAGGAAVPTFRNLVVADLPAGTGTITSIAITLAVPAFLTAAVAGSPLTTNGTVGLTITLANQNANLVFAGPSAGGAAPPTFRALVAADLPQTVTVLSSANILALQGTPITLVPAPGVGFRIVPLLIQIVFFGGTVAYTDAGGAVSFNAGTMSQALASNGIFLVTTTPNKAIQQIGSFSATDTAGNPPTDDNAALAISKATNNFAAGNGTAKITVQYLVLPTT
jgi:hypothetical protein